MLFKLTLYCGGNFIRYLLRNVGSDFISSVYANLLVSDFAAAEGVLVRQNDCHWLFHVRSKPK